MSPKDTHPVPGSPKHFKNSSIASYIVEERLDVDLDLEKNSGPVKRSQWVLNSPEPPGLWHQLMDSVKETVSFCRKKYLSLKNQPTLKNVVFVLQEIFPILV